MTTTTGSTARPPASGGAVRAGTITADVLRGRARALALWSLALVLVAAMYIAFWPSIGQDDALTDYVENLPAGVVEALGMGAIATPGGYLQSTVYGILAPALLLVLAVGGGAVLVAGVEEDGSLELELASSVTRRRVYVERLLALWVSCLLPLALLTLGVLGTAAGVGMDVGTADVLAGSAGLGLLVVALGTVALAVGAATGRRAVALGAAAALAAAAYVADALGSTVTGLGWLTDVSPWSWYLGEDPLVQGPDVLGLGLLTALAAAAAVGGLVAFERRDLLV